MTMFSSKGIVAGGEQYKPPLLPFVVIGSDQERYDLITPLYENLEQVVIWPTTNSYSRFDHKFEIRSVTSLDLGLAVKELLINKVGVPVKIIKDRKTHLFDWPEFNQDNTLVVWVNFTLKNDNVALVTTRLYRNDLEDLVLAQNHCFDGYALAEGDKEHDIASSLIKSIEACLSRAYYGRKEVGDPAFFGALVE